MSAVTTPSLQSDYVGSAESHEDKISAILDRDNSIKKELLEIYDDVKKFLLTDPDGILDEEIEAHYQTYKVSLDKFPKDLMGSERPIIFTGETSAGKSSLLNLLVGFDILPYGILPSTGVICRLRTSNEKRAEIFDKSGSKCDTLSMENGDEKAFKEMLKDKISPKENREIHNIQYVDLYWPIPFLRENVIVVDTPGIGESAEMTSRLKEYLPNAVALVYVLDISRGGGIQSDRIVPLLKIFNDHESDDGLKSKFDSACAIFIANKWDMVEDHETEKVKNFIKTELTKYWPHLQERQIYCLSTKKALKKKKKGKPLPDSYFQLRHGIEQLIEDKASLKEEEKRECMRLTEKVYEHLKDERNWDKIFHWENLTLPNKGDDLSSIKAEAFLLIQTLAAEELNSCLHTNGCKEIMNEMIAKVTQKTEAIRKARCGLEKILQDIDTEDYGNCKEGKEEEMEEQKPDHSISKGAVAIFAVTSPVWFPLALVGGLLGVPVAAAIVTIKDKFQVVNYKRNKTKYLQKWSKKYIDGLTEQMVSTWVEDAVFSTFNKKLDELFDIELPQTINGCEKLFANLKNEGRSSDTIRKHYQPKVAECERIMENLNTITTDTV